MSAYPLPGGRSITGALSVRLGRQTRDGRWAEQPAAKYECLICETTDLVLGADEVRSFVATIRTTHPGNCPGAPNHQGAQAA